MPYYFRTTSSDFTALTLLPGALGTLQALFLQLLHLAVPQLLAWLAQSWRYFAHWLACCLAHFLGVAQLGLPARSPLPLPLVLLAAGSCLPQAHSWAVTADQRVNYSNFL